MVWHLSSYSILLFIIAGALAMVTALVFPRRAQPGGLPLTVMLAATAWWTGAIGLEYAAAGVEAKVLLAVIEYPALLAVPVCFLLFTVEYFQLERHLPFHRRILLWVIPSLTVLFAATNSWHHFQWTAFIPAPNNILIYEYGPWFWISATYSYGLVMIALGILVYAVLRYPALYRRQAALMLASAIPPFTSIALYIFKLQAVKGLDLTPVAFAMTGALLAWNLLRNHILDVVPFAHERVLQSLKDGVIVVDPLGRVIDVNPAAARLLVNDNQGLIGKPAEQALASWPDLLRIFQTKLFVVEELQQGENVFDLQVLPLYEKNSQSAGKLITLHDITAIKRTGEILRQSEHELRALISAMTQDAIFVIDRRGHYIKVLSRNIALIKHEPDYLVGKDLYDVYPMDTAKQLITVIGQVLDSRLTQHAEYSLEIAERVTYFDAVITPISANTVFWVAHDITDHKKAQEFEIRARTRAEALHEITQAITNRLPQPEFFELVDQQLNRLMDARFLMIAECDIVRQTWKPAYLKDVQHDYLAPEYNLDQGLIGFVIQQGKPLNLLNRAEIYNFCQKHSRQPVASNPLAVMIVPLLAAGRTVGAIGTQDYNRENGFSADDFAILETVGAQVAEAFESKRLFDELQQAATMDSLTGLFNRRHFFLLGEHEFERARRYKSQLSAVMVDLDHFKKVNDSYGHAAGDQVLRDVSASLRALLRRSDVAGRYGGEELAILLPETSRDMAYQVADRLRAQIALLEIPTAVGAAHITASLGVACLGPDALTLEELLNRADQAMYLSKQNGRNRVEAL